jgi:hypothetical protein
MSDGEDAEKHRSRHLNDLCKDQPFATVKFVCQNSGGDGQHKKWTKLSENENTNN